jgi:hypothetical protein
VSHAGGIQTRQAEEEDMASTASDGSASALVDVRVLRVRSADVVEAAEEEEEDSDVTLSSRTFFSAGVRDDGETEGKKNKGKKAQSPIIFRPSYLPYFVAFHPIFLVTVDSVKAFDRTVDVLADIL